jgi:hypothetical protein
MALDPKKLQKKRARKAAKRKAVVTRKTAALPGLSAIGARAIKLAINAPIHECLSATQMFTTGMGTVIVSRVMPDGRIGASFFLLDVYCLGVKSAYFHPMSRDAYEDRLDSLADNETMLPIQPACARKLVEAAEAYARDLGFGSDQDYQIAKQIMGDIDASACATSFTFGKDGQPFFIAGPHDTPRRIDKIIETLTRRCGPNGFHYVLPLGAPFDFDVDAPFEVEFVDEFEDEGAGRKTD